MSYQANPAGLGVGKTYGPRGLGAVEGQVKTSGMRKQVVFQVSADTSSEVYISKVIQDGYLVDKIILDVEDAFASSSTANLSIDGGDGLTTAFNLASAGISAPALTGLTKTAGSGPVDIILTLNANAKASAAGKAKIVVEYAIA